MMKTDHKNCLFFVWVFLWTRAYVPVSSFWYCMISSMGGGGGNTIFNKNIDQFNILIFFFKNQGRKALAINAPQFLISHGLQGHKEGFQYNETKRRIFFRRDEDSYHS